MSIKQNAFSTLVLEFFFQSKFIEKYIENSKNPKIDFPYCMGMCVLPKLCLKPIAGVRTKPLATKQKQYKKPLIKNCRNLKAKKGGNQLG
jgi:hypothetical protein